MGEIEPIVDTSALISKKSDKGKISIISIIEFITWTMRKYRDMMKENKERALGYLNLIASLPYILEEYEILELKNRRELEDLVYYVLEKDLDPADAYISILAKRMKAPIMTNDKDFQRVKEEIKIMDP